MEPINVLISEKCTVTTDLITPEPEFESGYMHHPQKRVNW